MIKNNAYHQVSINFNVLTILHFTGTDECDIDLIKTNLPDANTWAVEYHTTLDSNVTWYHMFNGQSREVINSFQFNVDSNLLVSGRYSRLTYRRLTVRNNGEYRCVVSTAQCNTYVSFYMVIKGKII